MNKNVILTSMKIHDFYSTREEALNSIDELLSARFDVALTKNNIDYVQLVNKKFTQMTADAFPYCVWFSDTEHGELEEGKLLINDYS